MLAQQEADHHLGFTGSERANSCTRGSQYVVSIQLIQLSGLPSRYSL